MLVVLVPAAASARWLAPHFVCRELSGRIANPENAPLHRAGYSGLNTLPYRGGCTARYPLIGHFRKNSRAAGLTLHGGQPIKFSTPTPLPGGYHHDRT
jgi:hypothetical protein